MLSALLAAGQADAQTRLTPEAFLDRAVGNALTMETLFGGQTVGVEHFLSRSQTVWARSDGSCTRGQVTLRDELICFTYDDQPAVDHCWTPFLFEGDLVVRGTRGALQRVSEMSDVPVVCTDVPVS